MAEKPYDPDFKHLSPEGWQRLPRATRDGFMNSPHTPLKYRVWLYCLQVWDKDSRYALRRAEPAPIRQIDIVAAFGLGDDHVNHLVYEMQAEGMIHVRTGGRILPVEQPVLRQPQTESTAAAVKEFWAAIDPDGLKKFLAWEADGKDQKKAFRKVAKRMKEAVENAGPDFGPIVDLVGPAPETASESVGPPAHIRKKERRGEEILSSSSVVVIVEALSQYGVADDDAAQTLLENCTRVAPDATPEEIVQAIYLKGNQQAQRRNVKNPIGMLLTSVPNALPQVLKHLRELANSPPDMAVYIDGELVGEEEEDEENTKARGAT